MRVVFDAYWWVQGPAALRHVLREIVLAWRTEYPDDSLALVVRAKHLEQAHESIPQGVQVVPSRLRPQALLASVATERARRQLGFDAVVVHNFAARSRGLSAVYLHDVLFETNPEWFNQVELAYYSLMVRWIRRADVVFASTRTEAERIRAHTGARRVLPVGLGLSTELVEGTSLTPVAGLTSGRFLLTVGRLNVRKNLERTIVAALASGVLSPERPLVVVGGAGGKGASFGAAVIAAVADGRVRFLGHVDEAELRWLYASCELFVFLSLGEGFGMPPVEASFLGAAVLASDLPVFRENLAPLTTFVDPLDPESIAEAIRAALAGSPPGVPEPGAVAAQHDWRASVRQMRDALASQMLARTTVGRGRA